MITEFKKDMQALKNPAKIEHSKRFFKTGKGEYGEGDQFLGLTVPEQRNISRKYKEMPLKDLQTLLDSKVHEYRLTALFILVLKYKKSLKDADRQKEIVDFYLKNARKVNNWDLVDSSAPYILGDYLLERDKSILYKFAKSTNLWEKRIAMLATFGFIKEGEYKDALEIAEILVADDHDLIHKAVGWMLREIGNRDLKAEEAFLKRHYKTMPRTMLRYAIERFEEPKRKFYMGK